MKKYRKEKIIVIVGPTAVGKSDYAVKLAQEINGEVISADSRQVYKGLNIGSGKITKNEMQGVPHHLLDVADPRKVFSVDQYQKLGKIVIEDIFKKGKTPIICGGTGFYVDALVYGSNFPEVAPNKKLRKELDKKGVEELFKILRKLDSNRAKSIDAKNKVRLVRAIEIAKALGKVPRLNKLKSSSPYELEWIGLDMPDEILKDRIHDRLIKRIKIGMIKEVEGLHDKGVSWRRMRELGLEYRYVADYLTKRLSKEEMIEGLEKSIWQYVKRQRTWWKRNKEIKWIKKTG